MLGFLTEWILRENLNIPNKIPYTPINLSGTIIFMLILLITILSQKEFLNRKSNIKVYELTLYSTLICFIAEIIFQGIVIFFYLDDISFYSFMAKVIIMTIYGGVISFFSAFQLKNKKIWILILMIFCFLILLSIFMKNVSSLFEL